MERREDAEEPHLRDVVAPDVALAQVDDLDLLILRTLTSDSRISARQLAGKLGVSAPTVGERMARLERSGVIRRYTAEINLAALGYAQSVHVAIHVHDRASVPRVMLELWEVPEIETISMVTGEWDLIVRLRVRDYTHMRSILMDRVWELRGASVNMTTMMSVAEMPAKNFSEGIILRLIDGRTVEG